MILNQYKALYKSNIQKIKHNNIHKSISPIYKNYINNKIKNKNEKNTNSFLFNESNNNYNNNHASISNSFSKTTKNSPRNAKKSLIKYNKINNDLDNMQKFDTSINSPRNPILKKVNFKAKKLNLNVKTLNMNLEIKKYNDFSDNSEFNNNLSIPNYNNAFIEAENKRNEFTKIKLNDLKNQLNEIITPKDKNNSNIIRNNSTNIFSLKNTYNFTNNNSFMIDNYNLNDNISYENNCNLTENDIAIENIKNKNTEKDNKKIYISREPKMKRSKKKKRNELNIKLFNALKNNFIGIKLPSKDNPKKINARNVSSNKTNNYLLNQDNNFNKTQIEKFSKEKSYKNNEKSINNSIVHTINDNKEIDISFDDKYNNINSNNFSFINNYINEEKNNFKNNEEEELAKKYKELENKYEVLLQSYKKIKNENTNLSKEIIDLKKSNTISTEENSFLNNYIISLKKIINSILTIYSQQIQKFSQNVKLFSKNKKIENNQMIIRIKNILEEFSFKELETNKKIFSISKQLITENKILRKILITKKPNKNDFYQERNKLIDNNKDFKLNFNYNYDDFFGKLKKIENDYGKKFYIGSGFNSGGNDKKDKSNSVQKNDKKKIKYDNDFVYIKNKNEDNKKVFEKKKLSYNRNKKKK